MKKLFIVIIVSIVLFALSGCGGTNYSRPYCEGSQYEENPTMQKVETVEEFVTAMQNRFDISDVEKDVTHLIISRFDNGIRFKHLNVFFDLYKIDDVEFLEKIETQPVIFTTQDGRYSFDFNDLFGFGNTVGSEPTVISTVSIFVHGNFALLLPQLDPHFIRDHHALINYFFEMPI